MRTISRPFATLAFLVLLQAGAVVRAAEPAYLTTMAALPDGVRALLERREDGMADAGGPFSPWCRREPGTFHARLVSAEVRPDTVLVRYERGGIAGPLIRNVEFARNGDTWTEVVRPVHLAWPGQQRGFGRAAAAPAPAAPSLPWAGMGQSAFAHKFVD